MIELAHVCRATYRAIFPQYQLTFDSVPYKHQKIISGTFNRGYCRILWNDDVVTIAFRGTREHVDWFISNLLFFKRPLRIPDAPPRVTAHVGFQNALLFKDKSTGLSGPEAVLLHLRANNLLDRSIILTGHSLGGALAIIMAVYLRQYRHEISEKVKIVTFGQPAAGGASFYGFFGTYHKATLRVVNGADAIPFSPPIGYMHVGKELWLRRDGSTYNLSWFKRFLYTLNPFGIWRCFGDHSINSYMNNLNKEERRGSTDITDPEA